MRKNYQSNYSNMQSSSEKIEELLSYIPADPPYNDWIKIISAVCHEVGNEEEAEGILTNWSPDYGTRTTKDVIRSFHGTYYCSAGTLVHFARQGGYSLYEGRCLK